MEEREIALAALGVLVTLSQHSPPGQSGERCLPAVVPKQGNTSPGNNPEESNNSANGAATLLGWCLIVVAGTSYLYKLLV